LDSQAIGRCDEAAAHAVLDECLPAFGLEQVLRQVVLPTLKQVGDGWEREGESDYYFHNFSEKVAYPLGINIIFYAMTH